MSNAAISVIKSGCGSRTDSFKRLREFCFPIMRNNRSSRNDLGFFMRQDTKATRKGSEKLTYYPKLRLFKAPQR
jgi:hypothetical protein